MSTNKDLAEKIWHTFNSDNGRGWVRLVDLLKIVAVDPKVAKSPGASDFLAVMIESAQDSLSSQDAWSALLPLDTLLPNGMIGQKAKIQRNLASKRPRPNAKKTLRPKIIEAMHRHKSDCDSFKSFMAMWVLGHLDGLTVTQIESTDKYTIADENGDMGETPYTWGSLQSMYSKA